MKTQVKNTLKKIQKQPWIYKFLDKNKKIIYIWKSVNLHSRVNSYFNWKSKLNFAKQKMVDNIVNIETIITNNETESLILETTLIKKYEPKYNILMKDGKNHLYIKITSWDFPKIIKTRVKRPDWTYFGPYTSTNYVNSILKLIKDIFWYWVAEHNFFLSKNSYNLDKYIFKNDLKEEDYNKQIEKIKDFLKWNTKEVKKLIEEKMKNKASELKFEEANKLKTKLESISILEESQIVRDSINWDYDIINFTEKFEKIYVWLIEIRDSKITWFYNYDIKNELKEEKENIIKDILEKRLITSPLAPLLQGEGDKRIFQKIIIPFTVNLKENIFKNVKIEIPQIWTKKDLLDLCYKNIYEYAHKSYINSLSTKWFSKKTMQNILEILGYKQINKNIIFECNDISHISWNHTVASRSIIENWKSNNSKYKKFRIKTLSEGKIDDFNSMREVMTRRLKEIEKLNNIPDLIIIDWWKWQLSSVYNVIKPLLTSPYQGRNNPIEKLQLVWIAKKEEELFIIPPPNPLLTKEGEKEVRFKKIVLDKDSNELRLIQKIRDEAHRFAITFNRDSRIKSMKKNILEELPWFWPITRKKLLKKYWNIENLKNINKDELKTILNKNQIEILIDHCII